MSNRLFDLPEADPGPLSSYDWIVVNSSGGKDSQAMLDLVCKRAEAEGVLSRVVVVHADLGRVEWRGTREIAEAQAACYGVKFITVYRRAGDLLEQIEYRGKFPDAARRYCTSDHKRAQVHRVFTHLVKMFQAPFLGKTRPCRILNCLGMRAEESPKRSKMLPLEPDTEASNGKREVVRWLPLHRWSEDQVWERLRSCPSKDHIHYAYKLGMPRVSCCFCIFAPREALVIAGQHNPELLAEYVRVEEKIGHKFRQNLTMAEVQEAVLAGECPTEVPTWQM